MISEFKAFTATNSEYSAILNEFGDRYNNISKKSMYRDLAYNLIVLASASAANISFGKLELQPTGDIGYMLNKEFSIISAIKTSADFNEVDSAKFGCFGDTGTSIDVNTRTLKASYSFRDSSANCQSMAYTLGYKQAYGDTFQFKLDLGSFRYILYQLY